MDKKTDTLFMDELVQKGMLMNLTENSRDILIEHTHQLAILNNRLANLIDILSTTEARDELKKRAINGLLEWVCLNLLKS